MPTVINGTTGITFTDNTVQNTAAIGFRNRIINGAMMIDQRNSGASYSPTTTAGYTLDRWVVRITQNSKLTTQQNAGAVTPPAGYRNYLGVTSSSAYTVLSTDVFTLAQAIEGFNTSDLGFGTANASTVTLSFWVRSSLTGSFGGALVNSATNRSYPFPYTISTANTWEQKTVTIPGDTSGTWLTNNGTGIEVRFGLGAGSSYTGTANVWGTANAAQPPSTVSVVGTNGATFYVTGVQLERGSTASSFDFRSYGQELALCQRYASRVGQLDGYATSASNVRQTIFYPVQMRATPTVGGMSGAFRWSVPGLYDITSTNTPTIATADERIATIDQTVSGASAGSNSAISNGGSVLFSAEL